MMGMGREEEEVDVLVEVWLDEWLGSFMAAACERRRQPPSADGVVCSDVRAVYKLAAVVCGSRRRRYRVAMRCIGLYMTRSTVASQARHLCSIHDAMVCVSRHKRYVAC